MRTTRQAGLAVFASILTWVGPFTRMAFAQPAPQPAPVRPVTEMLHGVAVTDRYWWMEDSGQELTDWMKARDAYTRVVLGRIPSREQLLNELRALRRRLTADQEALACVPDDDSDAPTVGIEGRSLLGRLFGRR